MSREGEGPMACCAPRHSRPGWRMPGRVWLIAIASAGLVAGYLLSGLYAVGPDERAVVRRLGAVTDVVGPGIHFRLPWPVTALDVVKTTIVTKTGVGFALPRDEQEATAGKELLTGDTNILRIGLALQYVISDLVGFLFRVENPPRAVEAIAESILTDIVLGMPVDEILTTGRVAIQDQVKRRTQEILDRYASGVQVTSVNIMSLTLDPSVAQAFQDVADAMADGEKARNDARTYTSNLLPKARGEAHAKVSEAQTAKDQRIADALGETKRFLALLAEYKRAPDLTRTRLYAEKLEEILARTKSYIVDSQGGQVPLKLRVSEP